MNEKTSKIEDIAEENYRRISTNDSTAADRLYAYRSGVDHELVGPYKNEGEFSIQNKSTDDAPTMKVRVFFHDASLPVVDFHLHYQVFFDGKERSNLEKLTKVEGFNSDCAKVLDIDMTKPGVPEVLRQKGGSYAHHLTEAVCDMIEDTLRYRSDELYKAIDKQLGISD